jgi:hypothetical protein
MKRRLTAAGPVAQRTIEALNALSPQFLQVGINFCLSLYGALSGPRTKHWSAATISSPRNQPYAESAGRKKQFRQPRLGVPTSLEELPFSVREEIRNPASRNDYGGSIISRISRLLPHPQDLCHLMSSMHWKIHRESMQPAITEAGGTAQVTLSPAYAWGTITREAFGPLTSHQPGDRRRSIFQDESNRSNTPSQ